LFNASITENVTLGAANRSVHELQDLEQVANAANALEFIQQMEEGWGSSVGDGGNKLSGGQRQRLSIARALHKDPPVLLLDEATSALDTESEHAVQQAINRLMEGRTTLVVAHRLSTIRHADRIVVLDQGNIVEEGDHEALMARKGMYHRLVSMQDLK
jgi:subfamily B ATP-binding cassette protein MsbA